VASTRLQQQKQHLHRLQLQASAASSVMSGCADLDSSTFGFHPASFVFNAFPALSTLAAADWKNVQGQQMIGRSLLRSVLYTVTPNTSHWPLTVEKVINVPTGPS